MVERTVEDLPALHPDASGPTEVMDMGRTPGGGRPPSSVAPLAVDLRVQAPRDSAMFAQAPTTPAARATHLGWIAVWAVAGVALLGTIAAVAVVVQSSRAPMTIDARPGHFARVVEPSGVRTAAIAHPPLAPAKRRGSLSRH
jgi:hypothetical protein